MVGVYHVGRKRKADGKPHFFAPVLLEQEGVEEWRFEEDPWGRCRAAPTLFDACLEAGVEIKSIADVKATRAQGIKRSFDEMESDCKKEWCIPCGGATFDKAKKSLVVHGHSGTGKTNWAKAQFDKPFVISDVDDLKNIPERCDGLVFDDCEFAKLKMQAQKKLSDVRVGSTIHARHVNAWKPCPPAVLTTNNLESLFDFDSDTQAVLFRCEIWSMGTTQMHVIPE